MKACVLHKKGDLRYEDIPSPVIKEPFEVKVKMIAAGICGSDQHYYAEGSIGSVCVVKQPFVIGHEGCGIVEEVGRNVIGIKPGDMVVMRPSRPCMHCFYCDNHQYAFCENMQHLGSAALFPHTPGLFAEEIVVHQMQCRVVHDLKPEIGAFAEPLGIAYNGVHVLGDIIGKDVLVMGAGPIGCLCVAAAKVLGADKVTAIDIRDEPLQIAKQMGADEVYNSKTQPEIIAELSKHKGRFTAMIEASGFGPAAETGMRMTRPESVISQVGMYGSGRQPTDFGLFSNKGFAWKTVFRFYDEFGPCVNALERGYINPLPLLSASFPAAQCVDAMKAALSPETCKVQIRFDK